MILSLRRRLVLLALSLVIAAPAADAQTVVAGQVVNRGTRTFLPRILVELLNTGDSVLAATTTGPDGTFTLIAPGAGTYRVRLTPPNADPHASDTLRVSEGEYAAREFAIDPRPRAYLEGQVDRAATPAKDHRAPRHPEALGNNGISGCALVQFVVDEQGRADTTSFRALLFSRVEFAEAVRSALPGMRFVPAELGGRKVRQLVQKPFDFSIVVAERSPVAGPELRKVVDIRTLPSVPPPKTPPAPKPAMCEKLGR